MLCSVPRHPFSQLCFSSSMLCIRDWKDSRLHDIPYLAKTRLMFELFDDHWFGQKKELFPAWEECWNRHRNGKQRCTFKLCREPNLAPRMPRTRAVPNFGFGWNPAIFSNPAEIRFLPQFWPDFQIQPDLKKVLCYLTKCLNWYFWSTIQN